MITLQHFDARYLALRNCYEHRERIKALADYQDVLWDKQAGAWLVDNRLWDELAQMLGPWFAPASVEFWLGFHTYEPQPVHRRKTKQEILIEKKREQAAAGRFGRAVVGLMHEEGR